MEKIKEIFQTISIKCFIDYYFIFEKNKDSSSNQEIIDAFKKNGEDWTDKSCVSRAQKGKKIFQDGLEIDSLRYIINRATKISPDIKETAQTIYASKQELFIDPYFTSDEFDPYLVDSMILNADLEKVGELKLFSNEEKQALVKIRFGQSYFRNELINIWGCCAVTGCTNTNVLIASHIKAYSVCNDQERYDIYNGLLLSPCYDKLFDLHLISFNEEGEILISNKLSDQDLTALKISRTDRLIKNIPEIQKYLAYHRNEFYEQQKN